MSGKRSGGSYRIFLHAAVPGEIRKLPAVARRRVVETISSLAEEPVPPGASRIRGRHGAYRIRIADYRIVYEVHAAEIVVFVVGVAHRREVYRRILRRK